MNKHFEECIFCNAVLSKNSDNDSSSFCGNVNCPFSGIEIYDEWWDSAYCHKEIARLKKDLEEQCLLLGKSGSREAALLARIQELEFALKKIIAHKEYSCDCFLSDGCACDLYSVQFIAKDALANNKE